MKQTSVVLLLSFLNTLCSTNAVTDHHQNDRTKSNLLEETQFINPKSFDYAFDDDLRKTVDRNDIYDELVPFLPSFIVFKNGKEAGRTNVPIVTRKVPTWSTPSPREKYMEPYKPSSSKSLAIVRRLTSRDRTRPLQRSVEQPKHKQTVTSAQSSRRTTRERTRTTTRRIIRTTRSTTATTTTTKRSKTTIMSRTASRIFPVRSRVFSQRRQGQMSKSLPSYFRPSSEQ